MMEKRDNMTLRFKGGERLQRGRGFKGGERLQRGRGIGGILRLVKSVFSPLIKSAGKTVVKAVTSDTGKYVMNTLKDQAIDSGMKLAADALRGEDMEQSMREEMQLVKRKAADGLESVRRMKKQRTSKGFRADPSSASKKQKQNQLKTHGTKKPKTLFD